LNLKTLADVSLHHLRILSLGQNFKQLIIGKEEKPRKRQPLGLQIFVYAFLNVIQGSVAILEVVLHFFILYGLPYEGIRVEAFHVDLIVAVDGLELHGLNGHLPHDVVGGKDGLEVLPEALATNAAFKGLLH